MGAIVFEDEKTLGATSVKSLRNNPGTKASILKCSYDGAALLLPCAPRLPFPLLLARLLIQRDKAAVGRSGAKADSLWEGLWALEITGRQMSGLARASAQTLGLKPAPWPS